MNYHNIELINNKAGSSYEMKIDNYRSFIEYRLKDDRIYLVHTEVPPELEGKGLGAALVEKAFRDIEAQNLKVVPMCAYVKFFLTRHPEWNRIVA